MMNQSISCAMEEGRDSIVPILDEIFTWLITYSEEGSHPSDSQSQVLSVLISMVLRSCQPLVDNTLKEMGRRPMLGKRLLSKKGVNGGILALNTYKSTPIHDHVGSNIFTLIVSGIAKVEEYEVLEKSDVGKRLRVSSVLNMGPGEFILRKSNTGLIHSLTAIGSQAVFIDCQFPRTNSQLRHWYFPLSGRLDGTFYSSAIQEDKIKGISERVKAI